MCSYNNSIKEKMSIGSVILLIICGAANGLTDFSQKLYVRSVGDSAAVFNFYTYVFSAIVLLVVFGAIKIKDRSGANSEIDVMRKVGIYVLIMSICLFVNSYFKTKAAAILPSRKSCTCSSSSSRLDQTGTSVDSLDIASQQIISKCLE